MAAKKTNNTALYAILGVAAVGGIFYFVSQKSSDAPAPTAVNADPAASMVNSVTNAATAGFNIFSGLFDMFKKPATTTTTTVNPVLANQSQIS